MSDVFLYLTEHSWAKAWIEGGSVPVNPAADYFGLETSGTTTPDELTQREIRGLKPDEAEAARRFFEGPVGSRRSIGFKGCTFLMPDGTERIIRQGRFETSSEETIILSFSQLRSRALMTELGKVCCVRIPHLEPVRAAISKQLGVEGERTLYAYTHGPNRSHSIKGWGGRHMAEVRLLWRIVPATVRWVNIPAGVGELVEDRDLPDRDPFEGETLDRYQAEYDEEQEIIEAMSSGRWGPNGPLVPIGLSELPESELPPSLRSGNRAARRGAAVEARHAKRRER